MQKTLVQTTTIGLLLLLALFAGGSMAMAQTAQVTADVQIQEELQITDIKPVSFFEKVGLFFTFNKEKKADILQDFSNRNFALGKEKLERGNIEEAKVFFEKSDKYTVQATNSTLRIQNKEKQKEKLNNISVTASQRTEVLAEVQTRLENPQAQLAITQAIQKQAEVQLTVENDIESIEEMIIEEVEIDLMSETEDIMIIEPVQEENSSEDILIIEQEEEEGSSEDIMIIEAEQEENSSEDILIIEQEEEEGSSEDIMIIEAEQEEGSSSACNSNTAPWIKVVSPNGGQLWKIGQTYSVNWSTCNAPVNSWVKLSYHVPAPSASSYAPTGTTECITPSTPTSQNNYAWTIRDTLWGCSDAGWSFEPNTSFQTKIKAEIYTGTPACEGLPGPNHPCITGTRTLHTQDESDNNFTITNLP